MKKDHQKIPVTKPFLPPREEYEALLDEVWERNWLTNNGPLVQRLEEELKEYLDVPHLNYVSNGTIALQIAIKALGLSGEIITTPFSYVATTSSIVWEGCEPVFVDIDPETLNINPSLIEEAISDDTSAIIATHVFGNPCDIDAIKQIAEKYDLKIIYDAAHCFGTKYKGKSVFQYGDISTASFHATKLYHTIEGGAVITKDTTISQKVYHMRNFGHAGPGNFKGVGINGKNSEFHAAMGICNLKYIDEVLERRKEQWFKYDKLVEKNESVRSFSINPKSEFNFAYYPIIFSDESKLLKAKEDLESNEIYPRRYFYPLLTELEYIRSNFCENGDSISRRILCLPLYHELTDSQQAHIFQALQATKSYD